MTGNENKKIARWAGWGSEVYEVDEFLHKFKIKSKPPSYSTDAESVGLLNELVEKGYTPNLYRVDEIDSNKTGQVGWVLEIEQLEVHDDFAIAKIQPTIHEAIVSSVLQVIEKEAQDE